MATKKKKIEKTDVYLLEKKVLDLREALRTRNFKIEGSRSKNVKESRNTRKEIARILTELNKKDKKVK